MIFCNSYKDKSIREDLLYSIADDLASSKQYRWAVEIANKLEDKQDYIRFVMWFPYEDQKELAEMLFKKGIEFGLKDKDREDFFSYMSKMLLKTGKI